MNLKEWIALDPTTREEFQAECLTRGTPRQVGEIADEAAKLLRRELTHIPQVTDVSTGEDRVARRARLEVSTLLPEHEKLPMIPNNFAGFTVVQFGVADKKKQFLKRLEFTLRAANFSETEVHSWLNRHDESLNKIGSAYYLESPNRWIAEVLVTSRGGTELVGARFVELHGQLQSVLTKVLDGVDVDRVDHDPEAKSRLRAGLQRVFADCGINL